MAQFENLKAITWRRTPTGKSIVTFEYYKGPSTSEELDEASAKSIAYKAFWEYGDEDHMPDGRRWSRTLHPKRSSTLRQL